MKSAFVAQNHLNEFETPSARFRGAPFWAWNCRLDKDTLLRQIDTMKRMGLGGFTMHCRTGLDTPYMEPEFMDMIRACVDKARDESMLAYLYDEDRWPSGFGGGEVTKDPAMRSRYLLFTPVPYVDRKIGGGNVDSTAFAEANGRGTLLAAYDVSLQDGTLAKVTRILPEQVRTMPASALKTAGAAGDTPHSAAGTASASTAHVVQEPTSPTRWYAYLEVAGDTSWFNNQAYVNTLDKKAIERFIETTHEKYAEAVGADFGGVIPSIFTDEPQFTHKTTLGFAEARTDVMLPWTDDLEETFQTAYGMSLLDRLPELVWELQEGQASVVRYRYHDHIAERFAEAFSDTVGSWCRAHGIALTGHMMAESTLESQTTALGETMRHYRGFDVPGIDMLCNWYELNTAKQAQSAAHQMGVPDVLSELYGVTNWDFDFRSHKAQGDWQAALGITRRVHHLSWVSMGGEAKRDYPASMLHQSPWHEKYPLVEDYFARVNTALTSGRPDVRIGVVHPVESYWLAFGPEEQTAARRRQLQNRFEQVTDWLLFGMMDFDFISESLMTSLVDAAIQPIDPPAFLVGAMAYDVVVVPGCRTMRSSTVARLDAFARSGGTVLFLGERPLLIDAVPATLPDALLRSACIPFDETSLLETLAPWRMLELRDDHGRPVTNRISQLRRLENGAILFIAPGKRLGNTDVPDASDCRLRIRGTYAVQVLDALKGTRHHAAVHHQNGDTLLDWRFYQHDSLLLELTDCYPGGAGKIADAVSPDDGTARQVMGMQAEQQAGDATTMLDDAEMQSMQPATALSSNWQESELHAALTEVSAFRTEEPNVLVLDQAEFCIDGGALQPVEEILRIDTTARRQFGYPVTGGNMAQPWTQPTATDDGHEIALWYRFHSELPLEDVLLALERPDRCLSLSLNGAPVAIAPTGTWIDDCIHTIALPVLRQGENDLLLHCEYRADTSLEACFLLGRFGVRVIGRTARLTALPEEIGFGSLTTQGYPFYGGNVAYTLNVTVPEGDYALSVAKFRSPVLSVQVDGKPVGDIAWAPYRVPLGHLGGQHEIVVTAFGSRVNTFGCLHLTDENWEWFGPHAWRTQGDQFSYEYRLKETGILAAPLLYRLP